MANKLSQEQVLKNLSAVLEAGGSSLAKAVKVNIFLADMGDFAAVNEVYAKFFPDPKPVSLFHQTKLNLRLPFLTTVI